MYPLHLFFQAFFIVPVFLLTVKGQIPAEIGQTALLFAIATMLALSPKPGSSNRRSE